MSIAGLIVGAFRRWKLSVAIVAACLTASIALAIAMKPIYRAEAVVAPATGSGGLGALSDAAGQLGGIAAMAGLQLGRDDNRAEALGVLRSNLIIQQLVESNNLLPVLFAEKWDSAAKAWRQDVSTPTLGDALSLFESKILQVREELKSGLIVVRVEWGDRHLCAQWASAIVDLANTELRRRTIEESKAALALLQHEYESAMSVSLRTAISNVMEAQLRARTMAEVRKQFAFKVVDPPIVSDADKRVRPTRSLIALVGLFIGGLLAVLIAALLDTMHRLRSNASSG